MPLIFAVAGSVLGLIEGLTYNLVVRRFARLKDDFAEYGRLG